MREGQDKRTREREGQLLLLYLHCFEGKCCLLVYFLQANITYFFSSYSLHVIFFTCLLMMMDVADEDVGDDGVTHDPLSISPSSSSSSSDPFSSFFPSSFSSSLLILLSQPKKKKKKIQYNIL